MSRRIRIGRFPVVINGRWMAKGMTGTERYAAETTRELIARPDLDVVLCVPRDAEVPEWATETPIIRSRFTGMLFEQIAMPLLAGRRHLVNLSGPAPLARRNQSVVLFDASVFRYPHTFSRAFVAWYTILYWVLSRTARHVFTISEFSADEISEVVRVRRSRLVVATCGAEHAGRAQAKRPDLQLPQKFVVCIGTLAARKNLVPVVSVLAEAGIAVVVVGAAGKSAVFGGSGNAAFPAEVMVAGRLSDGEVAWLLDEATALVFPSLYEGFGLPVVEAQYRGCPVVCARSSSLPEVTAVSAVLFDPNRAIEAAEAIAEIQADAEFRQLLIDKGRINAARFTWKNTALVIAETLRGVKSK